MLKTVGRVVPTKPQVQTALTVARIHVHDIMARANQYQRTGGVQSNFKELQSVEALSVRIFGCGRQVALANQSTKMRKWLQIFGRTHQSEKAGRAD